MGVIRDPTLDFELVDLANYARYELRLAPRLDSDFPHLLAQKSLGSFVWMATACRYIAHGNTADTGLTRLHQVLRSGEGLDGLYAMILFGNSAAITVRARFLTLVLSVTEPLPLRALLQYAPPAHFPPDADVLLEARHMAPILSGILDDTPVLPSHPSLAEYLRDEARSGPFYIASEQMERLHVILDVFRALDSGNRVPSLEQIEPDDKETCVQHSLTLLTSRSSKGGVPQGMSPEGQSVWVTFVCRFVLHESKAASIHTWYNKLHGILQSSSSLDILYTMILEECCSEVAYDTLMLLLSFVIFSNNAQNLSSILELAPDYFPPDIQISVLRRGLWPLCIVLTSIDSEKNGTVRCQWLFKKFLLDERRSGRFHMNPGNAHMLCAECCIAHMNQHLKFNIADTLSSFRQNRDTPDNYGLPFPLLYSCCNWPRHALAASQSGVSTPSLARFLENRALHWIEAISSFSAWLFRTQTSVLVTLKELAVCVYSTLPDTAHVR